MKRKRFKEEQIIGILKEAEAGLAVQNLVRKYAPDVRCQRLEAPVRLKRVPDVRAPDVRCQRLEAPVRLKRVPDVRARRAARRAVPEA
jgi:hypothetical protein